MENVKEKLQKKLDQLLKIANSALPFDPQKANIHHARVASATRYISELKDAISTLGLMDVTLRIVPSDTFARQIEKSDFADEEFSGEFVKITTIHNFPYDPIALIWTTPLSQL